MADQTEGTIEISRGGRVVIPLKVRKKVGIREGDRLLVITRNGDILLRKAKETSFEEFSARISKVIQEEGIDIDKVIEEAVEWARKPK